MKKIVLMLLTSLTLQAKAQFLGGFFSQQSTREKLMAEQIVGYETYLGAIKGGYNIAEKGLNTAHELKNGTFGLHTAYFNSLERVSPAVQNNPKGRAIADMEQQIVTLFTTEISWQQKEKLLSPAELTYLQNVYAGLLKKCKDDLGELADVLTPGKLQLTDQQRLDRLDKLYAAMKDKLAFAGSFTGKCRKLATGRQQAKQDREQLKKLYGIQ